MAHLDNDSKELRAERSQGPQSIIDKVPSDDFGMSIPGHSGRLDQTILRVTSVRKCSVVDARPHGLWLHDVCIVEIRLFSLCRCFVGKEGRVVSYEAKTAEFTRLGQTILIHAVSGKKEEMERVRGRRLNQTIVEMSYCVSLTEKLGSSMANCGSTDSIICMLYGWFVSLLR